MFNYSTLPGSSAALTFEPAVSEGFDYTGTASQDETPIYQALNQRLTQLETITETNEEELQAIERDSANLLFHVESKEEVQVRIDWLKRLYKVKSSLSAVATRKEAERLRTMLSPVQTCPLKAELLTALNQLVESLPSEITETSQSEYERVMEFAIEQAGEQFINLGKAGREQVIQNLVAQYGDNVPVDAIQEATSQMGHQTASLTDIADAQSLQTQLEALPLQNYARLSTERKQMVAEQLIQNKQWRGLASLDRLILQVDAKLSMVEEQKAVQGMGNEFATAIDFKRLEGLDIQIR